MFPDFKEGFNQKNSPMLASGAYDKGAGGSSVYCLNGVSLRRQDFSKMNPVGSFYLFYRMKKMKKTDKVKIYSCVMN